MPIKRKIRQFLRWILQLHDTPESIAMGCAVGAFLSVTPTFGLQMAMCILISMFVRMNRLVSFASIQITNYLTAIPIYYVCYRIGVSILGRRPKAYSAFKGLIRPEADTTFWQRLGSLLSETMVPLWVGGVIVGIVLCIPAYYLTKWYVRHHRAALEAKKEQE